MPVVFACACDRSCRNRTICMTRLSIHPHRWRGTAILVPNFIFRKQRQNFHSQSATVMYSTCSKTKHNEVLKDNDFFTHFTQSSVKHEGETAHLAFNSITETHSVFYEKTFRCAEVVFHCRPRRETLAGGNINYKHWVGSVFFSQALEENMWIKTLKSTLVLFVFPYRRSRRDTAVGDSVRAAWYPCVPSIFYFILLSFTLTSCSTMRPSW